MSFLNSIAFWGLFSLVIPILIHLLSKRQQTKIYFGSNRFLEDKKTSSARSLQLNDIPLLLLRLLFLTVVIMAIANLVSKNNIISKLTYVEYKLATNQDYSSVIDDLKLEENIRYFTHNKSIESETVSYFPSAYTMIHHFNQSNDSITVYTHSLDKHFIGSKVKPNQNIDWNIIPLKQDNRSKTINKETLNINILNAKKSEKHKQDFKSVINSISEFLPFDIAYHTNAEWSLIIDTIANEQSANSISWDTRPSSFSFQKYFDNYKMSGTMNKKVFLESDFPLELTQALIDSRSNNNKSESSILDPTNIENRNKILKAEINDRYTSKSKYLWLLAMLLLLIERYFSLRTERS